MRSDCQCKSRNSLGSDPSILWYSGISGTADETVHVGYSKNKIKKPGLYAQIFLNALCLHYASLTITELKRYGLMLHILSG
jgi:hypothetical protein